MTTDKRNKKKQLKSKRSFEEMNTEEFIRQNADPIFLHQNELWEDLVTQPENGAGDDADTDIPF